MKEHKEHYLLVVALETQKGEKIKKEILGRQGNLLKVRGVCLILAYDQNLGHKTTFYCKYMYQADMMINAKPVTK